MHIQKKKTNTELNQINRDIRLQNPYFIGIFIFGMFMAIILTKRKTMK